MLPPGPVCVLKAPVGGSLGSSAGMCLNLSVWKETAALACPAKSSSPKLYGENMACSKDGEPEEQTTTAARSRH